MNVEKLNDELAKASAAKADAELDRMIKVHQDEVVRYTNTLKLYIQKVATVPGTSCDYTVNSQNMSDLVRNKVALQTLLDLKEELK